MNRKPISMVGFLAAGVILALVSRASSEESTPRFFAGGDSPIESDAPDRAALAIERWTDATAWEEDEDPTGAPYFWEFERVGRPVFLRVIKNTSFKGQLEVWLEDPETKKFELFKTYRIAYFSGKPGPKTKEGDLQAPEGFYFISRSRMNPTSSYHLSMDMGYPNEYDRWHERTGGYLMIHGKAVSIGCFAMTDAGIEQLYTLVDAALRGGQKIVRVHSFPFVMSEESLESHSESEHLDFWENLKEGWDWFERERRPPNVEVEDGRYVFSVSE